MKKRDPDPSLGMHMDIDVVSWSAAEFQFHDNIFIFLTETFDLKLDSSWS